MLSLHSLFLVQFQNLYLNPKILQTAFSNHVNSKTDTEQKGGYNNAHNSNCGKLKKCIA